MDLTGIIGHAKAVERLRVAIAAASQRGDVLPHVLIDGPADLGANQFAPSIARAIGRNLVELNGRDLQGKADLASALTSVEQGDVLAILDIDGLRPWAIRQLASAMEHFQVEFTLGKGPDAQTLTLPLKRFTVVATTARLAHVAPELREHFDLGLHLEQYGEQDITTVLLRYAEAEGIRLEHGAAEEIANRSGGSVRDGQRLLRFARDYAQTQSIPLDAACVRQAAALLRSG